MVACRTGGYICSYYLPLFVYVNHGDEVWFMERHNSSCEVRPADLAMTHKKAVLSKKDRSTADLDGFRRLQSDRRGFHHSTRTIVMKVITGHLLHFVWEVFSSVRPTRPETP